MKILRNHILKEFAKPFLFSLTLLLFILLMGRGFELADLIFNKNVSPLSVLKLLVLSCPFILTLVIPMSVLIATLLSFGKLSADNEIIAMQTSGVHFFKIITPLLSGITVLCLFCFLLSDQIASSSHFKGRQLLQRIGIETPKAALEEGVFIKKFKNFIIFIYEIDKDELKGIRIYQPQEGRPTRTIIAQSGQIIPDLEENRIKLKLSDGTSDEPDPKDLNKLYKLNFKTYNLPLNLSGIDVEREISKKPKDMAVKELRKEIAELGSVGIKSAHFLTAEIHKKVALSFASLVFVLIGIPLATRTRRHDKATNFGISLALIAVYWILLLGATGVAEQGIVPPFLALHFPNFLIGSIGLFFLKEIT